VVLLTFAASQLPLWRQAAAPAVVVLQTTRGTTANSVAAGRALTLSVDLTDLPQLPEYKLEVVDDAGRLAFQTMAVPQNHQLRSTLAHGLPAGAYFARLYSPGGELLREFFRERRG